ncbi:MAG: hypothetical protein IT464_07575 [Planctomycetes bacterium]|nr:hypothetical protein [Planctomycetota bacterium]
MMTANDNFFLAQMNCPMCDMMVGWGWFGMALAVALALSLIAALLALVVFLVRRSAA